MIDQPMEQRLQTWLQHDAAGFAAPPALQRRVLGIPAEAPARRSWWTTRFSLLAAPAATAVVVAVALVASSLFNVFDRPAGTDGGLCNNRQVHQALEALRDAPGYRYESRDELYDFDTTAEFSFDDPQYAWRMGVAAEGAYRAPDRVRELVTAMDGMSRGYVERLQVGDTTWRRADDGDGAEWIRGPNDLPTANMVYGYLQVVFPAFQVPGVTSLDWGGTPAPDDIPGSDGCTVATRIPGDGIGDIIGLRIDVSSGLPIGVYRGPPADATPRHGAIRYVFGLTWDTPAEEEFVPPADAVEAPTGEAPPPTPVPAQTPSPDAWQPQELPLPEGWSSGAVNAVVDLGAAGLVAVGSADQYADDAYESVPVVWTSRDGANWELVEDVPNLEVLSTLAWNGETLLATGSRAGSGDLYEQEMWVSPDGRAWTLAESFGTEWELGRPTWTSHGWVATATNMRPSAEAGGGVQMTPAMLHSLDGSAWTRTVLPDTGSGRLTTVVELASGALRAYGCESPGATNATQFGEMCLTRPWRSDDGITWAPGPVLDIQLGAVVADEDALIGIGGRSEPGRGSASRLYQSEDGESWTPDPFDFGMTDELAESGMAGGPSGLLLVEDTVVVSGSRPTVSPSGRPYPALWRSGADGDWEEIPIGFTEQGGYIVDMLARDGRLLLAGSNVLSETESRPVVWLEPLTDDR